MLGREELWQRLGGAESWGLAWVLALGCGLAWVLPETWDGTLPGPVQAAGWATLALSLPLALRGRWIRVSLALALAWGALGGLGRLARWEGSLPRGPVRLQGTLASPWIPQGRSRRGSLRVQSPRILRGAVLPLRLPRAGAEPPPPGTPVRFLGELVPVEPGPRFLAERPLWRARDAGAPRTLRLASARLLEVLGPPRPSPVLRMRTWVLARFQALPLSPGARDIWGALALGLPPVREDAFSPFARSGTLHVLVVSGLHLTLVMGALEVLWRRTLGRGSPWAALAGGLLFAVLVGFSAPVWRGFLMGLAWGAGRGTGWKPPAGVTLHGALGIWFLVHPAAGCDPGFLLSWMALVGLLGISRPLEGLLGPLAGPWAAPLAQVLAPWLTTLPLLALFQGGVPLWGVAANLVVLPLVAALVPLCLLLVILPLGWALGPLDRVLVWVGGTLAPGFARVQPLATGQLGPWVALGLGWLLLAQLHARFRRTRALTVGLVLASLALVAVRGTGSAPATLSLEALDIGQGDALLLRVPGGAATLVDTGPDGRAARRIVRTLSRRGVREPVHLVLTHPHLDHAGGWATLEGLWPLASVSRPAMEPGKWEPFGSRASRAGARPLRRGDAWTRGAASFSVRWPPKPLALRDVNMNSVVLRVRWEDRELWLMGDALASQEADLLDLGDPGPGPPGRILKVGHHGSRSATGRAWVEALAPGLALVCAGRDNAFGHPHAEALEALGGIRIRVTGACRGIRLEARPGGWFLETGAGEREAIP